jgi:hypothetical protein
MSTWETIINFNHTKNGFGENYFIKTNEDGAKTYFKDDLTEFDDDEIKQLLDNEVPKKFSDDLAIQDDLYTQDGGARTGFITNKGFSQAVSNLRENAALNTDTAGNYIYDKYDWSYTTSTKGVDIVVRYLFNFYLPVGFKDIMFEYDPIWAPIYTKKDDPDISLRPPTKITNKMSSFSYDANINNIIDLYFKMPKKQSIIIADNENNRKILKKILKDRFSTTGKSKQTLTMYLLQKNVSCININCPRIAQQGPAPSSIKMRQECGICKKRVTDADKIKGISCSIKDTGECIFEEKDIEFVCPRYCSNSKYIIDTKTWTILGNRPSPITYINKLDPADTGPLKDLFGNILFCPLGRDKYRILFSGIYEIDHINGNHWDNSVKNVHSLCKVCHEVKGRLSKDKAKDGKRTITQVLQDEIDDLTKNNENLKKEVLLRINKYRKFCLKMGVNGNAIFDIPDNLISSVANLAAAQP